MGFNFTPSLGLSKQTFTRTNLSCTRMLLYRHCYKKVRTSGAGLWWFKHVIFLILESSSSIPPPETWDSMIRKMALYHVTWRYVLLLNNGVSDVFFLTFLWSSVVEVRFFKMLPLQKYINFAPPRMPICVRHADFTIYKDELVQERRAFKG